MSRFLRASKNRDLYKLSIAQISLVQVLSRHLYCVLLLFFFSLFRVCIRYTLSVIYTYIRMYCKKETKKDSVRIMFSLVFTVQNNLIHHLC